MKSQAHSSLQRQQGMTLIGMIIIAILVAGMVFIAFKIVPIYMEYFGIKKAVTTVNSKINSAQVSTAEVQRYISNQFDIDYVSVIKAKDLKVRKNRGKVFVDVIYEDRRPLVYNLEIVANFNEAIQVYP